MSATKFFLGALGILIFHANTGIAQAFVYAQLQGQPLMNTSGWTLNGLAGVGDTNGDVDTFSNELILMPPVNSSNGGIFYDQPLDLSLCTKWIAEFEFRIFDGTAADGIAFCFLSIPPSGFVSGGGIGIPTNGTGLKIVFDPYDNGCGANPEIQVYSGPGYDECFPALYKVTNTGGNLNFIRSNAYNSAHIEYDSGYVTVTVNNVIWLNRVYAPANYTGYLGFTAGTGAQNDRHSIRNVTIFTDGSALQGFNSQDSLGLNPLMDWDCYTDSVWIKTVGKFLCSSIDSLGTEFRLYDPNGTLVPISKVEVPCTMGRSDSILIRLGQDLIRNGDYCLVVRLGLDQNPIMGDCFSSINEFDSLIIRLDNCYEYAIPVDVRNVTVHPDNSHVTVTWHKPPGLRPDFFKAYRLQRNEEVYGNRWYDIGYFTGMDDTVHTVLVPDPTREARDFRIILQMHLNPDALPGDSVSNILLRSEGDTLGNDTALQATISWLNYAKAWPNPLYQLWLGKPLPNDPDSLQIGQTTDTLWRFTKPLQEGAYRIWVHSLHPDDARYARSNYLDFSVKEPDLQVFNVMTPNGDGRNETFTIRNIERFPQAKVQIFNRWGQLVLNQSPYLNDFEGNGLEAGTYYYLIERAGRPTLSGALRLNK
jgi:gliding motility-associated-like protein